LQTRLNNPNAGAFILIMQRLHEKDLTGYILSEELGYEHVCLPSEATERTVIHFPKSGREIVREPGDLLNPDRFNKSTLDELKKSMGSAQYAGQMQQVPAPAEGIIFKREWMNSEYQMAPTLSMTVQSWDMPFTKSEGSAKCAGIVLGRKGADIYILDVVNDKMEFVESVSALRRLSGKWPAARAKVVENKANGPAIVSQLKREIPGMVEFNPVGSKEERAMSITPYFEAGNVHFPNPKTNPWVNDLINDLLIFPRGQYKDTVDALVQGILYLMDKPMTSLPPADYGHQRESPWRK
jgi:predicted phage terminase large subunit-like protein